MEWNLSEEDVVSLRHTLAQPLHYQQAAVGPLFNHSKAKALMVSFLPASCARAGGCGYLPSIPSQPYSPGGGTVIRATRGSELVLAVQ